MQVLVEVVSFDLATSLRGTQTESLLISLASNLGLDQLGPDAPHFVYTVHVRVLEPEIASFEIRKRFSEFAQLDQSLSALTKFLPYFPPRGAHRSLSRSHAEERMKLLNSYFRLVCRMEEVVHTHEFLSFFGLDQYLNFAPIKLAEVQVGEGEMRVSSIYANESLLVVSRSSSPSALSKASHFLSSWFSASSLKPDEGTSELQIWYRLPNSLLFERRAFTHFTFQICSSTIVDETVFFGTSDGRVGYRSLDESAGFLPGLVHVGPVSCLLAHEDDLWSGGEDGVIQRYSFSDSRVTVRMSSNGESASVTALHVSNTVLFVGLSTGVVNVFESHDLRLVTILQGPFTPIAQMASSHNVLTVTHSGGLVDSTEEANTVQFWDVADVLTRGTSKLAHWGPAPSAIVASAILADGDVVVATQTGAVNVFTPSRSEVTNRAKFIFQTERPVTSFCAANGVIFVGSLDTVSIWKLPPLAETDAGRVDISTPSFSQVIDRVFRKSMSRSISVAKDEDDLHSWARS